MSDKPLQKVPEASELKKLEQDLKKVNPELFKGLSEPKKLELLRTLSVSITHHRSGPLPSPEDLARYNEVIPNGAERIMIMAEKQQDHRFVLEKTAVTEQLKESSRGQIFGLIIGLVAILSGATCALFGSELAGSLIGGGGIAGLVSVFVLGRSKQAKSLKEKN